MYLFQLHCFAALFGQIAMFPVTSISFFIMLFFHTKTIAFNKYSVNPSCPIVLLLLWRLFFSTFLMFFKSCKQLFYAMLVFVWFNSLFEFIILECAYRYRYLSLIISRGLLQQKDNSNIKSGIKDTFPFHLRLSRNWKIFVEIYFIYHLILATHFEKNITL